MADCWNIESRRRRRLQSAKKFLSIATAAKICVFIELFIAAQANEKADVAVLQQKKTRQRDHAHLRQITDHPKKENRHAQHSKRKLELQNHQRHQNIRRLEDPCIDDFDELTARLENASDGDFFKLCAGTIFVEKQITVKANLVELTCATEDGSCILDRVNSSSTTTGPGRILNVVGNGLILRGIQFWNGYVEGEGESGGAVSVTGSGFSPVIVDKCTFGNNTASGGGSGGALYVSNHGCAIRVKRSTFVGNKASSSEYSKSYGGGLALSAWPYMCRMGCPYFVEESSFEGNLADEGGAAYSTFTVCTKDNTNMNNDVWTGGNCPDLATSLDFVDGTKCSPL